MKSVCLPPMLAVIEENTFYECENLRNITFPEALEKIGLFAFCKTHLEDVKFPASLREISQGAFAECGCLKTAEFDNGLETLGTDQYPDDGGLFYGVFEESALESVKLPPTLKRIEYNAFAQCKSLKRI